MVKFEWNNLDLQYVKDRIIIVSNEKVSLSSKEASLSSKEASLSKENVLIQEQLNIVSKRIMSYENGKFLYIYSFSSGNNF